MVAAEAMIADEESKVVCNFSDATEVFSDIFVTWNLLSYPGASFSSFEMRFLKGMLRQSDRSSL